MKFRSFYLIFIVSAISLCVGCTTLSTQITTYYNPSLQFSGKTYVFYRVKGLNQDTDMKYDYFVDFLAKKLDLKGMKQTTPNNADYKIILLYWIGQGQQETGYSPVYGQTGTELVSSSTTGTGYGDGNYESYATETSYTTKPIYGVVGVVPYKYTVYPYFIDFFIMKNNNIQGEKPLYHAALVSTSISIPPDVVFNTMLKGYMDIFPGINGETKTLTLYVKKH